MTRTADIVICGAGICGVSAAYFLSKAGFRDILLLDERPPLSLTSDRSTECYRNWWPDAAMLALMNRSIDLMESIAEETGNRFRMNRRGYLYLSADPAGIPALIARAERTSGLGGGPLRIHRSESSAYQPAIPEGYRAQPTGADLLLESSLIQKHFPYVTDAAVAALHVRRAGWLSAQQLGMTLLDAARSRGVRVEAARVAEVETENGRVRGVRLDSGERVESPIFVNAAGPFLNDVAKLVGVDLPVHTELHLKAAIKDSAGVVGRDAPLLIWDEPQTLAWDEADRRSLTETPETRWLTEPLPAGAHTRPEGGEDSQTILMLWEYKTRLTPPIWPPALDEQYSEIAMRGLTAMLPRMRGYFERMPRPQLDGGYYTRTRENRPLVGPLPIDGGFVVGAVSGYGIMAACGVGDLLAAHVAGTELTAHAAAFHPARYDDAGYQKEIASGDDSGQL
ncbi:MAG TPA: FAD-binding oxidoreductase [Anaerolineales bacterium]|jgi:glycine/D-amino acid oxidase-like deaminating enzyme